MVPACVRADFCRGRCVDLLRVTFVSGAALDLGALFLLLGLRAFFFAPSESEPAAALVPSAPGAPLDAGELACATRCPVKPPTDVASAIASGATNRTRPRAGRMAKEYLVADPAAKPDFRAAA